MKIIHKADQMQYLSRQMELEGKAIGFVPTMGFLHEGHTSLIKIANEHSDVTVVSIFVNPTQFSPDEDFEDYPRDFDRDKEILRESGTDILFLPDTKQIYAEGFGTFVEVEGVSSILEGKSRPAHFRGVTTVVSILMNIVKPKYMVLGQKDAQQSAIINKMIRDLHFDTELIIGDIIREDDGLAKSSRNIYLKGMERSDSALLSRALEIGRKLILEGIRDSGTIIKKMKSVIGKGSTTDLDYIAVTEFNGFKPVDLLEEGREYYILIACRVGKTRLIDNIRIKI